MQVRHHLRNFRLLIFYSPSFLFQHVHSRRILQQKIKTNPVGFELLPELFTLTQLQRLYEAVNGEPLDKRNFRKRIKEMDFIEKTELIDKLSSKRGAVLYRFNKKAFTEDKNFKL